MIAFLVILSLTCVCVQARDTGQTAGLMADCPGMNRSTILSEETKRSLIVVVAKPSTGFFSYREKTCKLSEQGATCAAEYLDLQQRKTQVIISGYLDGSFSPLVRFLMSMYISLGRNVIVLELFPVLVRPYPLWRRHFLSDYLREKAPKQTQRTMIPFKSCSAHAAAGRVARPFPGITYLPRIISPETGVHGRKPGAHIASYAALTYKQLTGRRPARLTGEFQTAILGDFIMPCLEMCSHIRSAIYLIISYKNPDKFIAVRCNSLTDARHGSCYDGKITTNIMGPETNFNKTGLYYLPTDAKRPYYLGLKGLKKRKYGVNDYLLTAAPDEDMIL